MADTPRTRAALQTLLADNNSGEISAQDLRDFLVTALPAEFVNEYDFWAQPLPANMTDKTVRGQILYSQEMLSLVSFCDVVCFTSAGNWKPANITSVECNNGKLGIVVTSTAAADSCNVLLKGLVYDVVMSVRWGATSTIGAPVYLMSVTSRGTFSTTSAFVAGAFSVKLIGHVGNAAHILEFDPDNWHITGA